MVEGLSENECKERAALVNIFEVVLENAQEAKTRWLQSKGTQNEAFDTGVVQGYWEVLTTLKSRLLIHEVEFPGHDIDALEPDEICWR